MIIFALDQRLGISRTVHSATLLTSCPAPVQNDCNAPRAVPSCMPAGGIVGLGELGADRPFQIKPCAQRSWCRNHFVRRCRPFPRLAAVRQPWMAKLLPVVCKTPRSRIKLKRHRFPLPQNQRRVVGVHTSAPPHDRRQHVLALTRPLRLSVRATASVNCRTVVRPAFSMYCPASRYKSAISPINAPRAVASLQSLLAEVVGLGELRRDVRHNRRLPCPALRAEVP